MNETIELIEKEMGHVIEIEERVPMWKMPFVMGKDYQRILSYFETQESLVIDAPYARYLDIDWDAQMAKSVLTNVFELFFRKWHFLAGIPSSKKLDSQGDLISRTFEKRTFVKTTHRGPYQKVGSTYKAMYACIKSNNIHVEGESIEMYLNDPRSTKKEDLETLVLIPVTNR